MNFYCRLMATIWSYISLQGIQPATLLKLDKIFQTCFFSCKSMKSENFSFQLFSATLKIALAASTLWQNICKTLLPQKRICSRVHSHHNSNFKIYKWKLKNKAVYSVVHSTAQVFLHSRSQKQPPAVFCKKGVLKNFTNLTNFTIWVSF